jgi:hypothetical protein
MKRRSFVAAAAAPGLLAQTTPAAARPSFLELRWYWLRNNASNQRATTGEFLTKAVQPALRRAGAEPAGLFSPTFGDVGPTLLVVTSYSSMQVFEDVPAKMAADTEYQAALKDFYAKPGLPFERITSRWLRSFRGFPKVEYPPQEAGKPARVFELRTYESSTPATLDRKVGMFEAGEIAIFRKAGLTPVFFGVAVAGDRMPNLTYMLVYDNLAAREANWRTFSADPDWQKLRATPGLADAEIVSNIQSQILAPVNGWPLR